MVTMAPNRDQWQRASYLDLDGQSRAPQAIAALLPQVLARYCTAPEPASAGGSGCEERRTAEKQAAA